jgi:hypothetical protein
MISVTKSQGETDPIFHAGLYYGRRMFHDAFFTDRVEIDSK